MIDPTRKGSVILIADDDMDDCFLMAEAFKNVPSVTMTRFVSDGQQLMAYLQSCDGTAAMPRPDLILLDLNMPIQDGREALL